MASTSHYDFQHRGPVSRRAGRPGRNPRALRRAGASDDGPYSPPDGHVHVWSISVRDFVHVASRLESHLSHEERGRAARLHVDRDRVRFVVARGMLRQFLGEYTNQEPANVRIAYGPRGKPVLDVHDSRPTLHFNTSHSDDAILFAFSRSFRVGIDVESLGTDPISPSLAGYCLSRTELTWWNRLPADERRLAFYTAWTRKEAYIKGLGLGMTVSPSEVTVSLRRHQRLPGRVDHMNRHTGAWTIRELPAAKNARAALAVEGSQYYVLISRRKWITSRLNKF